MKINCGSLARQGECHFSLPKEVNEKLNLPQNRIIVTNVSPEEIVIKGNYVYDLILKEGKDIVGRYNSHSIKYSEKTSTLNLTYSLFSAKPRTKVPSQLFHAFSNFQEYVSSTKNLEINHFVPIITNSKKAIPGLIKILEELGYEKEHPTEPFYGKTWNAP